MKDITVQELKAKLDAGEQFLFIDVREPAEYEAYNIGAKLIPLGTIPDNLEMLNDHKDSEIVVHCRSGARSGNAKMYLEQQGYTKVSNVLGGVLAWQQAFDND